MKYPKIETLFNRNKKTFKVNEDEVRLEEFNQVKSWYVTEKVDGTNVRVFYQKGENTVPFVHFAGRTDKAQFHPNLTKHLEETFTIEKLNACFPELSVHGDHEFLVILYGEGYGVKIQSGGNYRKDISFRLFDVLIDGLWLEPVNIQDIATKLEVYTVPSIGVDMTIPQVVKYVKHLPRSHVSMDEGGNQDYVMEGIVARTVPLMLTRRGDRVMFKLKVRDFKLT